FGAPLAALLPVVLAVVAVSVALAGLYFLSSWVPVSLFAENVVSMIGLGVGVDYALFVLSRFREELDTGSAAREAARAAVRAAGPCPHVVLDALGRDRDETPLGLPVRRGGRVADLRAAGAPLACLEHRPGPPAPRHGGPGGLRDAGEPVSQGLGRPDRGRHRG